MKKNITINLCGRLFQIDEDAYDMLQHYVDSLRSHFSHQSEGDEIVNDIEERIAELFEELNHTGVMAITIDHVKDIITRIGQPEELAGEDDSTNDGTKQQTYKNAFDNLRTSTSNRRLFRNPNDKMVAGVLSGLAAYTNTDVIFWRLGAVLITLLWGTGLLLYIIMAIIMPEAKTPEQRLQMEGKEINPKNLADEMVDEKQAQPVSSNGLREVVSVLLKIVIGIVLFFLGTIALVLGISFLGVLMAVIFAVIMPAKTAIALPFTLSGMGLAEVWANHPAVLIALAIALLATLFIPVYAIVHLILSYTKRIKHMSVAQRIVWVVLWLVSLCALIPLAGMTGMLHDQYRHERLAQESSWMTDEDREYLDANGWTLQKNENCHNDYVKKGEYFTGDPEMAYLDAWDASAEQVFQVVSHEEVVDSGTYRITCNARAEDEGVYIFAKTPANRHKPSAITMVPAYGNQGGKIWEEALDLVKSDSLPLAERARKIREANNGNGYGWSTIELIVKVEKPRTTLSYGVSTWEETTEHQNQAQWFSACDFKLEKVE